MVGQLVDLGLLDADRNFGEPKNQAIRYRIADPALRFHFGLTLPNESAIATAGADTVWRERLSEGKGRDRRDTEQGARASRDAPTSPSASRPKGLVQAIVGGHIQTMSVTISELKSRLSYYLRRVRAGESIVVRDRDTVIARIEPAGGSAVEQDDEARWLAELERRGVVRRASGKLDPEWLASRPRVAADVVHTLVREREEGR
jgi:antitoxin (DNA-binding transcriptional repressor) of toxin-antitoxin stability system